MLNLLTDLFNFGRQENSSSDILFAAIFEVEAAGWKRVTGNVYHVLKDKNGKLSAASVANNFLSANNRRSGYFGHFRSI